MIKNIALFFLTIIIVASCSSEPKYDPPIPFEKMQSILFDIYTAEVEANIKDGMKLVNKEKDLDQLSQSYTDILYHYQLTYDEFQNGLNWYIEHPLLLDSVYKGLISLNDSLESVYEPLKSQPQDPVGTPPIDKDMEGEINSMNEHRPMKDLEADTTKNKLRPEFLKRPDYEDE